MLVVVVERKGKGREGQGRGRGRWRKGGGEGRVQKGEDHKWEVGAWRRCFTCHSESLLTCFLK